MKKFILYIIGSVLPAFIFVAMVNTYVDPAHRIFRNYEEMMISVMSQGHNITNISNLNERKYKKGLIELYKNRHFDYIILGASPIMGMGCDMFEGKEVLNLGISAASFRECMSLYEISKENGITADTIILGALHSFFSKKDNENLVYEDYYNRLIGKNVGNDINQKKNLKYHIREFAGDYIDVINGIFDPVYFKSSLKTMLEGKMQEPEPTDRIINDGYTWCKDGSICYALDYRTKSIEEVDNLARNTAIRAEFTADVDSSYFEVFDIFVGDCKRNNTELVFFLMPMHPIYYQRIFNNLDVSEHEKDLIKIANAKDITVFGSFTPAKLGFDNNDYYDNSHLKKQVVNEYVHTFLDK